MAIKQLLSGDTNSYGINFSKAYFKIEDVSTDFDLGKIKIYVRAYASGAAREKQRVIESNRKKYQKLSMGGDDFDIEFEKSIYTDEGDYRNWLDEQQDLYIQNIVGIFKEKYEVDIDDLNIESFTKDGIMTAAYSYLKTLDAFKKGEDC